jgi:putrescine transport system permease protein
MHWIGILSNEGFLNRFLLWTGLISSPTILNTGTAILHRHRLYLSAVYDHPDLCSAGPADDSLIEAAEDLGCSRLSMARDGAAVEKRHHRGRCCS